MNAQLVNSQVSSVVTPLRLGFAGVGWIGRDRMQKLIESGLADAAGIVDPAEGCREEALQLAPEATVRTSLDELIEEELDGIVIATPSALHARQARAALEAGLPVFCQKPLGRTARETREVVDLARERDLLLGVDFSYRFVRAFERVHDLIARGEIGEVYASELTFHNAYGPDKQWFYDPQRAGGGCLMDLGIHLVDMAIWMHGQQITAASGRLFCDGRPISDPDEQVEQYASVRLDMADGAVADLSCSWNLPAGREAVIEATFYGTEGGLAVRNVDGSFYDFRAERFDGTERELLVEPPDEWGGRAAIHWAEQLMESPCFRPEVEQTVCVAEVLDEIYGRSVHRTLTGR